MHTIDNSVIERCWGSSDFFQKKPAEGGKEEEAEEKSNAGAGIVGHYALLVLIVIAKTVTAIVILFSLILILALVLPLRLRISGFFCMRGSLEDAVEGDALVVWKETNQDGAKGLVFFDTDFTLYGSLLKGALTFTFSSGAQPQINVLGFKIGIRTKRRLWPKKMEGKKEVSERKRRGFSSRDIAKWFAPQVRTEVTSTLKALKKATHFSGKIDMEFGFLDPGLTGMIYGAFMAFSQMQGLLTIRLRPRFEEEVLSARGNIEVWAVPVQIFWIIGRFLFSREIKSLWRKNVRVETL